MKKSELEMQLKTTGKELMELMPPDTTSQGYCYKTEKRWEDVEPDEVVYIPECAYSSDYSMEEGDFWYLMDVVYTKQDFVELCKNCSDTTQEEYCTAEALLDMVDWQCPETLLDEMDLEYGD